MKRIHIIATLTAVMAVSYAQTGATNSAGKAIITSLGASLTSAKTMAGSYIVQDIGGAQRTYSIALQKPNLARVETPDMLYVADGKNLTIYDKGDQSFVKMPQNIGDLRGIFAYEDLNVWAGFFTENAYRPVATASKGTKTISGKQAKAVEAIYDANEQRVVTYYVDTTDGIAHKALVQYKRKESDAKSVLIDAPDVALNKALKADTFEFKAPSDARELSVDEYNGGRWYTDMEQAKSIAQKSGKRIFVDFMASWCGPCKRLEAEVFGTSKFKALSKKFVFARIDVDEQKGVAAHYKIEAMPTQLILNADGSVAATRVGYSTPADFFEFILGA